MKRPCIRRQPKPPAPNLVLTPASARSFSQPPSLQEKGIPRGGSWQDTNRRQPIEVCSSTFLANVRSITEVVVRYGQVIGHYLR
jgi:hypothetical protein